MAGKFSAPSAGTKFPASIAVKSVSGRAILLLALLVGSCAGLSAQSAAQQKTPPVSEPAPPKPTAVSAQAAMPPAIPVEEFSRMVQDFSEPGGYFQSDNFTSNETSYLHVVDKLKELGISGGAYLGVGPEQNFTYIAKIHPQIAFIVDIRREAILEHLMYKAIFHQSKDRAEFLSLLFSKPLTKNRVETKGTLLGLLKYIYNAPVSEAQFNTNFAAIRKTIANDFDVPLSESDVSSLTYVYRIFWRANLGVAYGQGFPNLAELILETDLQGRQGNFLASDADYQFVRELQERNRLIPVVGDFTGEKALATVAGYLRKNHYTVSAFYTSNVEEYLYQDGIFDKFEKNVAQLPISDHSVFIRSLKAYLGSHPAWVRGFRMITLLEKMPVFLDDYKAGLYPDYWSLVTTHYISGNEPHPTDSAWRESQ